VIVDMNDFENIRQLIKYKETEIKKRTSSGIHEEVIFKRLLASCTSYKDNRPFTGILSIIISIEDILKSQSASVETLYDSIDRCVYESSNHVKINENYEFVDSERIHYADSNQVREIYRDLSKDDYCVIVLTKEISTYFIDGDVVGDAIFFTKEDLERFERRKDISELNELFKEYRRYIELRPVYQNFFVSKSEKRSLFRHLIEKGEIKKPGSESEFNKKERVFLDTYRNLLQNKPEDRFRENLRNFLDDKLKGTVYLTKEHILENFKRIDIFINDEFGELYLIEVKWIGLSIHATGTELGTKYEPSDINPDAITQTLLYLSELYKNQEDIKMGYLAVFDARDGDDNESVPEFDKSSLPDDLEKFYHRFKRLDEFIVNNTHPN
jgi:hypothetical protein